MSEKNKIIGLIYNICILYTKPFHDLMAVLTSITCDCGVIGTAYKTTLSKNTNYLIRGMAIGTHPKYDLYIQHVAPGNNNSLYLAELINKIVYDAGKWPEKEYKESIISYIYGIDENIHVREILSALLTNQPYNLADLETAHVVGGLYCLIKFLTNPKDLDISVLLAESLECLPAEFIAKIDMIENEMGINHLQTYKFIATGLIGVSVGYQDIYKHQPYFHERNSIDICLKLYFIYLAGEKKKTWIGYKTIGTNKAIRYMHPPKEPHPIGIWAENSNPLAKYGVVSYVEYDGHRYANLADIPADVDKTILAEVDKKFIEYGEKLLTQTSS